VRRISFATTGWFDAPSFALGEGWNGFVRLPVIIAICERDDGSIWLVDAGWSARTCAQPLRALGVMRKAVLGVRVQAGDELAAQMRAAGLEPGRVSTILATHLHLDHLGGAADFPNAEVVTTDDEIRAAKTAPAWGGYLSQDLAVADRFRAVTLSEGTRWGFPRSLQLDDDLTLLDARGHTCGHCAVLIRGDGQSYLHAGDAGYTPQEFRADKPSLFTKVMAWNRDEMRATQRRLAECERAEDAPRIVLSHDLKALQSLPALGSQTGRTTTA
jgi:glyoxylase-like metal-dependent hydrolase (beta-lactamase superfamily II)